MPSIPAPLYMGQSLHQLFSFSTLNMGLAYFLLSCLYVMEAKTGALSCLYDEHNNEHSNGLWWMWNWETIQICTHILQFASKLCWGIIFLWYLGKIVWLLEHCRWSYFDRKMFNSAPSSSSSKKPAWMSANAKSPAPSPMMKWPYSDPGPNAGSRMVPNPMWSSPPRTPPNTPASSFLSSPRNNNTPTSSKTPDKVPRCLALEFPRCIVPNHHHDKEGSRIRRSCRYKPWAGESWWKYLMKIFELLISGVDTRVGQTENK